MGIPGKTTPRSSVLHLNFSHDQVTEQSVEMQYGHPPNLGIESGDILGSLKTVDGKIIREFDLSDPRVQLGDAIVRNNGTNQSITGSAYYSDSADFTLVLPYYQNQMTLDLTDKNTGRLLKSVNFSQAIERFQKSIRMTRAGSGLPVHCWKDPLPFIWSRESGSPCSYW